MSINWNQEVKMKDVAKFFNQEIDLGDINYNKCLQVSALIVAFGVIPSFTYGTVLGSLDGQRVALMAEVSALQAEALTAAQSIPKYNQVVYNAAVDKASYTVGSPVTVTYYNLVATTTNVVSIDLYSAQGSLVQKIATMIPYAGPNKYSFNIATSTLEKGSTFFIRVSTSLNGQNVNTNKFVVHKYAVDTRPVVVDFVSSSAYRSFTADADGEKDVGTFVISYKVSAGVDNDIYLRRNGIVWATTTDSTTGKVLLATLTAKNSSEKDTRDSYFIPKGVTRLFVTQVDLEATKSGNAGITIKSIEWGHASPSPYPNKTVLIDSNVFKTDMLSLSSLAQVEPKVSVRKITSAVLQGAPNMSDIGSYRFNVVVSAGDKDIYVSKESDQSKADYDQVGFVVMHNRGLIPELWPVNVIDTNRSVGDTTDYFFIKKNSSRELDIVVSLRPTTSGAQYLTLNGLNWKENPNSKFSSGFYKIGTTTPILPLIAR
jgi:hypothetical protein